MENKIFVVCLWIFIMNNPGGTIRLRCSKSFWVGRPSRFQPNMDKNANKNWHPISCDTSHCLQSEMTIQTKNNGFPLLKLTRHRRKKMKVYIFVVILLIVLIGQSMGHSSEEKPEKSKSEKKSKTKSVEEVCPNPHELEQLPEFAPYDCAEIYQKCMTEDAVAPSSGMYTIYIGDPITPVKVYCDMEENGGGWTVFQNRYNGRVNFQREWLDYVEGFGNPGGEYWLGLYYMHWLTNKQDTTLCITLTGRGETRSGNWSTFSIGGPATAYSLNVDGFSGGDLGDSLTHHSGKSFTTVDNDNDNVRDDNCAAIAKGGWWYRKCHRSNLNGLYLNGDHTGCCEAEGMEWRDWGNQNTGYYYSYLSSVMKIRPGSF